VINLDNKEKEYYEKIHEYLESLSDEEFDNLLKESGSEKCPYFAVDLANSNDYTARRNTDGSWEIVENKTIE
jgi:hypothetical protein